MKFGKVIIVVFIEEVEKEEFSLSNLPTVSWRSNQFILKEISPGCSLEGLMLKLKLQYFVHLMQGKDSDAGRDWGQEEKETTEDEMAG